MIIDIRFKCFACLVRDIIWVENGCFCKKRAVRYEMYLIDIAYLTARFIWVSFIFYQYFIPTG